MRFQTDFLRPRDIRTLGLVVLIVISIKLNNCLSEASHPKPPYCSESRRTLRARLARILDVQLSRALGRTHTAPTAAARRKDPGRHLILAILLAAVVWMGPAHAVAQEPATAGTWWIEVMAGNGQAGSGGDGGPAKEAQLNQPFGVVRGPDGAIWFCEYGGHSIRRIDADGRLTTVSGDGTAGHSPDGTSLRDARFNLPHEIRFDDQGRLLVVDMGNHQVRRLDFKNDRIETIAGTGKPGYSGDGGIASHATLKQPHSIQFDPSGHLYICDIGNHAVRRVDATTQEISTILGTGRPGTTESGGHLSGMPINGPRSLDVDAQGHLWLATREGNQLFELDLVRDTIHHRAGTGSKGLPPLRAPAKSAVLNGPKGVAIDAEGCVWIVDTESHSILRFDPKSEIVERIAGTGTAGDGPDGPALECALARPHGIFADRDGSIWIGDSSAHRLRRITRRP